MFSVMLQKRQASAKVNSCCRRFADLLVGRGFKQSLQQLVVLLGQPDGPIGLGGFRLLVALQQTAHGPPSLVTEGVEFLPHFEEPAAPRQTFFAHDAGQHLVGIGILFVVALQSEGARIFLPGGDDERLGGEGRLALLFQMEGGQKDFFGYGTISDGIHTSPHAIREDMPALDSLIVPSRGGCRNGISSPDSEGTAAGGSHTRYNRCKGA